MPPYLRLVLASACWNASKMIFCFSAGMPMPVSATSKATTLCAWLRIGMARGPACGRGGDLELNAATLGELERVRQQVLEHLLQALGVGDEAAAERRIEVDLERKLPRFGFVAERPADRIEQVGEEDLFRLHGDRSGFDLRQVENVADQVEQVGAGAVDGARELRLLCR